MKNKKITYALIVSVAAVWGIIFYRVFQSAASGDDYNLSPALPVVKYEALDNYELKDTFTLALDYPDPFLKGNLKNGADVNPVEKKEIPDKELIMAMAVPPPPDWNNIKYSGFVTQAGSKQIVSILTIHAREYMLIDGQSADGVRVIRNARDSVQVLYKRQTRFLKIQ